MWALLSAENEKSLFLLSFYDKIIIKILEYYTYSIILFDICQKCINFGFYRFWPLVMKLQNFSIEVDKC